MGSVITHFFARLCSTRQLAEGRKVCFGARSSRSKKLRIAFVTFGSMVDSPMARKGRVAGRGGAATSGAATSGTTAVAVASAAAHKPSCLTRGACRGARNTELRPRAKFGAHKGGNVEIELYAIINREKER
jgi:hypothetical protein